MAPAKPPTKEPTSQPEKTKEEQEKARLAAARKAMVERQMRTRDIRDPKVLAAMEAVPRSAFVPPNMVDYAHEDRPLPIGQGQTISQPYIVALMTQLARARPGMKALDVGTGSGYQAAVLAEIVDKVYGIEILCSLADAARDRLKGLGYKNITVRCGDGYQGWKEHAPFDLVIVAAAPDHVPKPLNEQLAPGGRMAVPVGPTDGRQLLKRISKDEDGRVSEAVDLPVAFVPLVKGAE